jgi:hypothetical protein
MKKNNERARGRISSFYFCHNASEFQKASSTSVYTAYSYKQAVYAAIVHMHCYICSSAVSVFVSFMFASFREFHSVRTLLPRARRCSPLARSSFPISQYILTGLSCLAALRPGQPSWPSSPAPRCSGAS